MFHFILQGSRNAISNEKIKPFCFNTIPSSTSSCTSTPTYQLFSLTQPWPGGAHFQAAFPLWPVPYPSILPPLPAPLPAPSLHPHPLSTGKHIFLHTHHVAVGCACWCQSTHGRLRQQRLHGCTELLLCWWIALGFCGTVLAVPGMVGRSQELALAISTDLMELVWCQVPRSLLGHLSVCPLWPCSGAFLCRSEAKPDVFCKAGCCLSDWQHHWHHHGTVG